MDRSDRSVWDIATMQGVGSAGQWGGNERTAVLRLYFRLVVLRYTESYLVLTGCTNCQCSTRSLEQ